MTRDKGVQFRVGAIPREQVVKYLNTDRAKMRLQAQFEMFDTRGLVNFFSRNLQRCFFFKKQNN